MRPTRRLLSRRVALLALGVIGSWLVVLMTGLNLYIDHELRSDLADTLRVRAQAALSTVVTSSGHISTVRDVAHDEDLDNGVWVISGNHAVTDTGVATAPDIVLEAASGAKGTVDNPGRALLYVDPVMSHGRRLGAVVVAADTGGIHNAAVLTLISSVVVGGLLMGGVYLVLRQTVARALSPVSDMTQRAQAWSIDDPGRRFGDTQRFLELASLAHTLDALLDRVSAVLRHERTLNAELSHELRTPLSRIKAESELLIDGRGRIDQQAVDGINESTARMERIIETLLTSARTENASEQGRCAVADAITAALAPWRRTDVEVSVDVAPADLHAGVDLNVCERIIAPIVDNAQRFSATAMSVRARSVSGRVEVDITNDGPPLEVDIEDSLFRPGTHSPDPSGHDGSGLGLALARRLARAADGEVRVSERDPVTFRIVLPS